MKQMIFTFGMGLLLFGCTTAIQKEEILDRRLDFSKVEQIAFGKATQGEAVSLFGQPDQIIHLKGDLTGKNAWIYNEVNSGQKTERLGLLVDQKTSIVQSATWVVREGDTFREKTLVLSHFKGAKFIAKEVGWIAKHYYSDDVVYSDPKSGLSFYVNGARRSVQSISFASPVPNNLAKNE